MLKKLLTVRTLVIVLAIVALYVVSSLLGLKVPKPEVSVAAEPVFHIGSFAVTNALLTAWLAMLLLVLLSWLATRRIPRNLDAASNSDLVPRGWQNVMEMVIEGLHNLVQDTAGSRAAVYFPIVTTIFLFVIVSNWFDVLPGFGTIGILHPPHGETAGYVANGPILTAQEAAPGTQGYVLTPLFRPPSTDLNFTLALALVSVGLSEYFGIRALGARYFKRFFDISGFKDGALVGVAQFAAGLLELVSEFSRIISFSFRLFGNIFAGEVLLGVMAFLVPYVVSLPFYGLEVFVGFIQAVVFMMLTLSFFVSATAAHGTEEHH